MTGELEVHYPDLVRGADRQSEAGTMVAGVQSLLGDAALPAGSMGKLPGSGDVVEANATAVDGATEFLSELDEALRSLAGNLRGMHDMTRETDDAYAEAMTKLQGAMG